MSDRMREERDHYRDRVFELRAEIEQLQQALKTYGKHLPNCTDVPLFCDCGLLKLINQSVTKEDSGT